VVEGRSEGGVPPFFVFVFGVIGGFLLILCLARLGELERRVSELERKVSSLGKTSREK